MSVSNLLSPLPKAWANLNINALNAVGVTFSNSSVNNLNVNGSLGVSGSVDFSNISSLRLPGEIAPGISFPIGPNLLLGTTASGPLTLVPYSNLNGPTGVQGPTGAQGVSGPVVFPILASNGSGSNPSYSFASDNSSGLYLVTPTSDMRVALDGSDILQFTPSLTSLVNGSFKLDSGMASGYIDMNNGNILNCANLRATSSQNLQLENNEGDQVITVGFGNTRELSFYTAGVTAQPAAGNNFNVVSAGVTAANIDTTYDGSLGSSAYSVGQIVRSLKALGLIAL